MAGLHAISLDVKPCIFIRKAELKVGDALYEVNERMALSGEEVSPRQWSGLSRHWFCVRFTIIYFAIK